MDQITTAAELLEEAALHTPAVTAFAGSLTDYNYGTFKLSLLINENEARVYLIGRDGAAYEMIRNGKALHRVR